MKWSWWPLAVVVRFPLHWFRPGWLGLSCVPCLVLLDDAAWGDEAVLRHELQHQRQGWRYLWVGFWLLYLTAAGRDRLEAEALGAE